MSRRVAKRPAGSSSDPVRSMRVAEDTFSAAKRRAENEDGVTVSFVVQTFLEMYGKGMLSLPRMVMSYDGTGAGGPAARVGGDAAGASQEMPPGGNQGQAGARSQAARSVRIRSARFGGRR